MECLNGQRISVASQCCAITLRKEASEHIKKTDTRPDARHPDAFLSICGVDFSIGRHCSFKPISHFASSRTTAKHTSVQSRSNTGFPTPFQPQDFSINCDRRRIVYKYRKRPRWVSNSCRILNSERLDGQVTHPSHQHSMPPFRRNAYRHTGFRMLPSPFSSSPWSLREHPSVYRRVLCCLGSTVIAPGPGMSPRRLNEPSLPHGYATEWPPPVQKPSNGTDHILGEAWKPRPTQLTEPTLIRARCAGCIKNQCVRSI